MAKRSVARLVVPLAALAVQTLFAWSLLHDLGRPLLWHDEGLTAMYGRRVLETGVPKVHGARNTLYGARVPTALGIYAPLDAYRGSPWGQYYFAAPAVAWSDGAHDLAERTRRVRLPFAAAGWLGTLLLGIAAARLWPRAAGGTEWFWLGYGVCLLLSVSLQLHLREVRYYPLVVLGVGAAACVETARPASRAGRAARDAARGLVPLALFNVFYPAFGALILTASAARARHALRAASGRGRPLARALAPYAAAGAAAVPLGLFYAIPDQALALLGGRPVSWVARLGDALHFLLRFELLGPALCGAAALVCLRRGAVAGVPLRAAAPGGSLRATLDASHAALLLVAVWVAVAARTPFFFERYFGALSPLLGALCVLQAGCLAAIARAGPRRAAAIAGAVLAAAGLASAAARLPELRGWQSALREPYRGPLDHVIPYLASRYPAPEELVIATNYEDPVYMFYLGSRTTLGFYAPDLERDLALRPDVIVPRPWRMHLRALEQLAGQAEYRPREFPVANLRANNVPSLSPRNAARLVHRFASPAPGPDASPLLILERVLPAEP